MESNMFPNINKALIKIWKPVMESYMLSPRYCRKHFKEKYAYLKDDPKYTVYSRMGLCSKCHKLTEVSYIHPIPNDNNNT